VDEEGLAEAGGVGCGDVGAAVSYHDAVGEGEAEFACAAAEHAGAGFSVLVLAFVGAYTVLGVVGAVVDRVELDAFGSEGFANPVHEGLEVCLGVEAAGDSGLVGYDDQAIAEGDCCSAEREDSGDEAYFFSAVEVADFFVDYAVTVEEEGTGLVHEDIVSCVGLGGVLKSGRDERGCTSAAKAFSE